MIPKKIAVLMGGWSVERDVSLKSGASVVTALQDLGHHVIPIDVSKNLPHLLQILATAQPDVIFNALHGIGGEDGVIQGALEFLGIPYTHSGVTASAIAMDKVLARRVFRSVDLPVPVYKLVSWDAFQREHPMEMPYVVKPLNEGSSKGITIVHTEADRQQVLETWSFGDTLLIEKFIRGREIQVAMQGDTPLGAIEIRPHSGFYDYEAKYTDGKTDHIMPAPLSAAAYQRVLDLTAIAHRVLGCQGISRTDFMYDEAADAFYLLELNTHPGFTKLSLVPEIAAYHGITFPQLVQWILDDAEARFVKEHPQPLDYLDRAAG